MSNTHDEPKTRAELKARLAALNEEKYCLEMSDDFCYGTRKMDAILSTIRHIEYLIANHPETLAEKEAKPHGE